MLTVHLVPCRLIVIPSLAYKDNRAALKWLENALGGKNTQRVHVRIGQGIDEHCARARQAGAKIVMEPADQFHGDRTYIATDLGGQCWTFSQPARTVSNEEMERASGFKFERLR